MKYPVQANNITCWQKTMMIILLWTWSIIPVSVQAQQIFQKNIQLQRTHGTFIDFLKDLSRDEQINFSYDEKILPATIFQLNRKHWVLQDFLKQLEKQSNIRFTYINGQILLKRASKKTVNGTVKSKNDGEQLIGATIYVKELGVGTTTNAYGFYSLTLPVGEYTIIYSYIGFEAQAQKITLKEGMALNVTLVPQIDALNEVVVKAVQEEVQTIENTQMSSHSLTTNQIKRMPMFAGESDVLKSMQFLPGVQSAHEGTTGFSVRGGSYDQNLVLLDEAPVYNIAHSMGLFSVFNTDAIKNTQIYKGAIPARYGGRLSSVIDVRMKEGNDQRLSLSGGIGLVSSRLTVEGPIGKKTSFIISGRGGYPGYSANQMAKIAAVKDFGHNNEISFYDINAKINVKLNPNNTIYFSAYTGSDHFFNDVVFEDNTLDWGNQTGTFRWNHVFSPRLFGNLTLIYSNFDYAYAINNDSQNFRWTANFQQQGLKMDFDYFATPQHTFKFGASLKNHRFSPGQIQALSSTSTVQSFSLDTRRAIESAIYASHEWDVSKKIKVNYGFRLSAFYNIGDGIQYTYEEGNPTPQETAFGSGEVMNSYYRLAPRASIRYLLNPQASIKVDTSKHKRYFYFQDSMRK